MQSSFHKSFVIECFRSYHQQLLLAKASALSGEDLFTSNTQNKDVLASITIREEVSPDDLDTATHLSPKLLAIASHIQQTLQGHLFQQMEVAIETGGDFVAQYYKEAQYLMVAFTDEIFINLPWAGKKYWEDNLFEARLYKTHVAGQAFFDMLDTFLKTRDPATRDLGAIYLWILGLGFEGKYRGTAQGAQQIDAYKEKLYRFIFNTAPQQHIASEEIFKSAYADTLTSLTPKNLPNPTLYTWTFFGVLGLFILCSFFIWQYEIADLDQTIHNIIEAGQTRGAS